MDRSWLPNGEDLDAWLAALKASNITEQRWESLTRAARTNLDFASCLRLDRALQRERNRVGEDTPADMRPLKLALLSTSTTNHLLAGIRVAGLGRGLLLEVHETSYGQGVRDLIDVSSPLHLFSPEAVLFADDPYSLFDYRALNPLDEGVGAVKAQVEGRRAHWRRARDVWRATVLQQIPFNPMPRLLGENEARLPGSAASLLRAYQTELRAAAAEDSVDLIDLEHWASKFGLAAWHSSSLWNRSKQEVHPAASLYYGDLVARVLAASTGRSAKCLVLDLDNTLWGGVIGDDGLEGIVIGQGSAAGEGHLALQVHAKQLSKRGIILAVCSKNDDAVARAPFERHPDMALRLEDIASFQANWTDKPTNLRRIASELNIGLDALVFVDDNPFERDLVRRELPQVFVPEMPEEPSDYAATLSDSGYFEGVAVTRDDAARTEQYQANAVRRALRDLVTDVDGYLAALDMTLIASPFDAVGLTRITQLINKTNQFNLTTRRYAEAEVADLISDPTALTLQIRLKDRIGDNGVIAVVIAKLDEAHRRLDIEAWLMSCRVLGRQVEGATLHVMVEGARRMGATSISGRYIPTPRNGIVRDHFVALGFDLVAESEGVSQWILRLEDYTEIKTHIRIESTG